MTIKGASGVTSTKYLTMEVKRDNLSPESVNMRCMTRYGKGGKAGI